MDGGQHRHRIALFIVYSALRYIASRDMGHGYSVAHAAILAAQLPEGARSLGAIDPVLSWSTDRYLLASIEYSLRALLWTKTKDAAKGRNRPKMVPTPSQRERLRKKVEGTDIERIRKALGIGEG